MAAALLVTACGGGDSSDDGAGAASRPDGGWSFTDDRGVTHALDAPPDVIVAQSVSAGGLSEYGVDVAGVFGPLRRPDGTPQPSIGLADPDTFTSLGEIDGEVNLEALAALRPDIIVTQLWGDDTFWGIDDELDEMEALAPVIAIRVGERSVDEPLTRLAELAMSLDGGTRNAGDTGDVEGRIAEARGRFDAASERLAAALAAKPVGVVTAGRRRRWPVRDRMTAVLVVGVAAAAVGLGPACSTSDEARPADPAPASEGDGAGATPRGEHPQGTTEVPPPPPRGGGLDAGTVLPSLLELGVTVVGTPLPDDTGATVLLGEDELAGVESMGFPEPSLERIVAARPDLIVGLARNAGDLHDELSRIAPTVLVEDTPSDWRTQSARIADAVNRTEAFETALAAFDDEVEALRTDLGDRIDTTVSVVRALADHVRIHTQHHFAGQVIDQVGLARPTGHRGDDPSVRQVELNLEQLPQADADVVYLFGAGTRGSAGGDVDDNLRNLEASPLWAGLDAVERDAVHVVDPLAWQQGGLPRGAAHPRGPALDPAAVTGTQRHPHAS